jgi:hypothetical protein
VNTKVPVSLRITPVGKYNPGIYTCYNCNWEPADICIVPYALGFFDCSAGTMIAWECPKCFKKQFFHARLTESRSYNYLNMFDAFKAGILNWKDKRADKDYVLHAK